MEANIQKLEAFAKAVEFGSFTRAADALAYSQSGVSRMIADLEREWNLTLLERGRGGVRLTSDGMKVLPHVKSVLAQCRKLQTQVEELQGLESGLLRIGTFTSAASQWLPNVIRAFQRDFPGIEYELLLGDYHEIEEWMDEGRVDCGVVKLPTRAHFETIVLGDDRFMAILPEGHPLATLNSVPLERLCEDPFMSLESGANREVMELFRQHGLKPNVRFTTWDDYAIMSMVENGLGVSILPKLVLRRVPYRIAVRELAGHESRTLAFAVRDARTVPQVVKRFIEYLDYR